MLSGQKEDNESLKDCDTTGPFTLLNSHMLTKLNIVNRGLGDRLNNRGRAAAIIRCSRSGKGVKNYYLNNYWADFYSWSPDDVF